jgi:hypothetical protein
MVHGGLSLSATTHAPQAGEVEQIQSNLMALFGARRVSCDRVGARGSDLGISLGGSPLQTRRFAFAPGHKGGHQPERVRAKGTGDCNKFNDIEPTFAPLVFGHKGLRLFQKPGEGVLGEPGGLASPNHEFAKGGLIGSMDGFADTAGARCHQPGKLIPSSDYPKRG